uniref:(California timema) hypothetical protein n=1 Tax=Timema californicum TaxID=61474 RepID=A0A7R9PBI5_TIMCA|nr:unnamed protein product [Timema californicum]
MDKELPNLARSQNTYAGYPVSRLLTLSTPIQSRTPGIGLVAVKPGSFPKHVLRKSGELAVASKYAHSVTYTGYRVKVMKDNDKLEEMRYYVEETLIPAYMKPRCYCIPILLMSQFFLMFGHRLSVLAVEQDFMRQDLTGVCDLCVVHAAVTTTKPP